jgi:hypothetical protein
MRAKHHIESLLQSRIPRLGNFRDRVGADTSLESIFVGFKKKLRQQGRDLRT